MVLDAVFGGTGLGGTGGEVPDRWDALVRQVAVDGSAGHPHCRRLTEGGGATRDLVDLVHALCTVHGRQPGMIDEAAGSSPMPDTAHGWLGAVAAGFVGEREHLARLIAAVGPLPSTPGQADSEAALTMQRHALATLARSERAGCMVGSIAALALDWAAIRVVLDRTAARFDVAVPPQAMAAVAPPAFAALLPTPGAERAMGFGAQQLLAQHRGLWDLLEARAEARA